MDNKKPIKFKNEIVEMSLDEVCKKFEFLVCKMARRWTIRYEFEDVKQVGYMGLVKAYESYDIGKNVLFSTYASILINRHLCGFYRDDKSKFIGIMSLNQSLMNDDNKQIEYIDLVKDENNYEDMAITSLQCEDLMEAINKLEPINKKIVELLAFQHKTQVEVSRMLNISYSSVARKYKDSLNKMKNIMEGDYSMPMQKLNKEE